MSAALDNLMAELDGEIETTVKRLTAEVTAELVEATPVDTGWARANWIPYIGGVSDAPVGAPGTVPVGASDSAVAQVVTSYRLADGVVTVTNNVPYIRALYTGTVRMSPRLDVDGAIDRAKAAVLGGG